MPYQPNPPPHQARSAACSADAVDTVDGDLFTAVPTAVAPPYRQPADSAAEPTAARQRVRQPHRPPYRAAARTAPPNRRTEQPHRPPYRHRRNTKGKTPPDAGPQPPPPFAPAARAELLSHAPARERGRLRAARAAGVVRGRWFLRFRGLLRFARPIRCDGFIGSVRGQSVRAAAGGRARSAVAASAARGRPGFRRRPRRGWSLAVGQSVERPAARPLHRRAFR